ncbi:MAG: endonuclease Q family protein [candidate division WOR-3 bacterium]
MALPQKRGESNQREKRNWNVFTDSKEMEFIADFHIHSPYSRAVSKEMTIKKIAQYARYKGIKLVGTSDFTHPEWLARLKEELKETGRGVLKLEGEDVHFILTTEVNNLAVKDGKLRRIHNIIFTPSFGDAERINQFLSKYGNLSSDGRPTLSLSSRDMLEGILNISPDSFIVPSHIWTPWFSLFGSVSGYDAIEECFEDLTDEVFALETGLSSDPKMNWRLSSLDRFSLISCSDAHSPQKLGREANVFFGEISFSEIKEILKKKDKSRFLYTIEFFPEEGKYHYDGHRNCGVNLSPKEAILNNDLCPVCGKRLTIGVLHRVELLADREEGFIPENAIPYKNLIPLDEIIADALKLAKDSLAVKNKYLEMVKTFGPEFDILLKVPTEDLKKRPGFEKIGEGIEKMRKGEVKLIPGYDGVFGKISLFSEETPQGESQMSLF